MPGQHVAWQLDSGIPPPGGYRIDSHWTTGLVLMVARLFG